MIGLIFIILTVITLIIIIWNQPSNRKLYAILVYFLSWIFIFRFACSDLSCITTNFISDSLTYCSEWCEYCKSNADCPTCTTDMYKTVLQYQDTQKACAVCKKCSTDWNIRIAFDSAGFTIIGLALIFIFLYYKNYSLNQFMQGLNSINLFGVLSFNISEIENEIEKLNNERQGLLNDAELDKVVSDIFTSIHRNSNSPIDLLFLILDKIKENEQNVNDSFNKNEKALALKDAIRSQFENLQEIAYLLHEFVKNDKTSKFINSSITLGKQIIRLLMSFINQVDNRVETAQKQRYLKSTIGVGVLNDRNIKILHKGERIPVSRNHGFETSENDQKTVVSPILIGESDVASENFEFDTFTLEDVPPLPAGQAKNEITIEITKFGILKITQICNETGNELMDSYNVNDFLIEKR